MNHENQAAPQAGSEYLIEMTVAPPGAVPTPTEGIAFTERFVLPTLEKCQQLVRSGEIAAGGPISGAMGFAFILRASSPEQVEEIVAALPLWPRSQTRVVPLVRFESRAAAVRTRLVTLRHSLHEQAATVTVN